MSKLTLDEAIKHCEEVAEEQERKAQFMGRQFVGTALAYYQNNCFECATEHRQLAEWLKELKSLRKKAEHLTEWNRKLIDYKNKIICKWGESQEELQEAKRLLKAAVEDFSHCSNGIEFCYYNIGCGVCADCNNTPCNKFQWRYTNEALKLIES